jgi:hypothetical protein
VKALTFADGRLKGRAVKLVLGGAAAAAIASTALGGSLATAATHSSRGPAVTPTTDIVGTGLVDCKAATGEVGYSPASISGGTSPMMISIWFKATDCGSGSPIPKSVVGSISFESAQGNACPLLGFLGQGTLNLAYNYPPVPNPMIDPSVATSVSVTQSGPYWTLKGAVQWGSYATNPPTAFTISLKPNVIGSQTCGNGITSEYIARSNGPLLNI